MNSIDILERIEKTTALLKLIENRYENPDFCTCIDIEDLICYLQHSLDAYKELRKYESYDVSFDLDKHVKEYEPQLSKEKK